MHKNTDAGKKKKNYKELPAAPSLSASFSIILKFSALFNARPPVTTTRAFPRSGRSVSCDVCFTYRDLPTESANEILTLVNRWSMF